LKKRKRPIFKEDRASLIFLWWRRPEPNRHVISQELQRNGTEDRNQVITNLRDGQHYVGLVSQVGVIAVADGDDFPGPSANPFDVGDGLFEDES